MTCRRGGRIRTGDHSLPKRVRYQAALHPEYDDYETPRDRESMGDSWRDQIEEGAAALGIAIPEGASVLMSRYLDELYRWNDAMNLTRVPAEEAAETHILDSLSALLVWPRGVTGMALDVGTGAGLPGVPLALALPTWRFLLMDGTRKKLEFVEHIRARLGIANIEVVHARAEECTRRRDMAGAFDVVVARAVARMERLVGWMLPLVRAGGLAIAYKTPHASAEIAASAAKLARHGCILEETVPVCLPFSQARRLLVLMRRLTTAVPGGGRQ